MLDDRHWRFLRMMDRYGEAKLVIQGKQYYAVFPDKPREVWGRQLLVELRAKYFIRTRRDDPEHIVLTKLGQYRLDCHHWERGKTA